VRRTLVLLTSLLFLATLRDWAQGTSHTVGTVLDSTGGVALKATFAAAIPDKGCICPFVSGPAGEDSVSAIAVGDCMLHRRKERLR